MAGRTFAIGDVHGDAQALLTLLSRLPHLDAQDTLVFLGDYVDRGPESARVVSFVRTLPRRTDAKIVTLRGNHEDAWLRVVREGWPGFVIPAPNGCFAAYRSFSGGAPPREDEAPSPDEMRAIFDGRFFPEDVVAWMHTLLPWYEDEHAIYVHAGLPKRDGRWLHPSEVQPESALFWARDIDFFRNYRGKKVVVGHTVTALLPPELSSYTPEDPADLWAGVDVYALDTGCGKGGFLTALELPSATVYESR